ncbi:MAG: hypothetical protein LQ351_001576 [Letrouitia transgressa]|nr:MAG: hypothetical protein LQ351_001576 [Letrouitia transgressa]
MAVNQLESSVKTNKSPPLPTSADQFDLDNGKWKGGREALPFYNEAIAERSRYRKLLSDPQVSAIVQADDPLAADTIFLQALAVSRLAFAGMWARTPAIIPKEPSQTGSRTPAQDWHAQHVQVAKSFLGIDLSDEAKRNFRNKMRPYSEAAEKWVRDHFAASKTMEKDRSTQRTVFICPPDAVAIQIKDLAVHQWQESLKSALNDESSGKAPAQTFIEYLQAHREPAVLLRTCQLLEFDQEGYIDRRWPQEANWAQEFTEFSIGLFPILGNAVALYEVKAGHDLFGNKISPVQRAIMLASVIVPLAARFAKGGRALYSEERLSFLLGKRSEEEGKIVTKALDESANASKSLLDLHEVAEARSALFSRTVAEESNVGDAILVNKAFEALKRIFKTRVAAQALYATLSEAENKELTILTEQTLETLAKSYGVKTHMVDGPALMRMFNTLRIFNNESNMKGQLLEELAQSQIMSIARRKLGTILLGIENKSGKGVLEYWPGHLVKATDNRLLSDGLFVLRLPDGKVKIVAVIEAKAGKAANIKKLAADRVSDLMEDKNFQRAVEESLADQQMIWDLEGKKYTKADIEVARKALLKEGRAAFASERGQFSRTLNRLETDKAVYLNGRLTQIEMNRKEVNLLAVVAKDGEAKWTEAELDRLGLSVEWLRVDFTDGDLRKITRFLQDTFESKEELLVKALEPVLKK